jgi:hypothetical protein
MEKNTFTIDAMAETVTLCHETKTTDGKILCETTFDISKMKKERRLKRIADAEVIAWRARTGIKELTTAEAIAKGLQKMTVDTSATLTKVKHVETAEEKELKALVASAMKSGGNMKEIMAKINAALATTKPETETDEVAE